MSSKKRTDRSESGRLPDENPFAALASLGASPTAKAPVRPTGAAAPSTGSATPAAGAARPSGKAAPSAAPAAPPWSVSRTRKGGWPVSAQRRKGGKWVTVIERVSGDGAALLGELRRRLGSGGALRDGAVEIQGQQVDEVIAYLDEVTGR